MTKANASNPYVTFMKHAQKLTKSQAVKTRPILQGVIHREDYIAATDSHRLYYATDIYDGSEKNVNPVTGEEVDAGEYPDVERLFPYEDDAKYAFELDVNALYETVRAIEIVSRVNKATDIMQINVMYDCVIVSTDEKAVAGVKLANGVRSDSSEIETLYASIKYVKEALMLFKEAGAGKVTLNYHGTTRPFTLKSGNLTALILPVRVGGR